MADTAELSVTISIVIRAKNEETGIGRVLEKIFAQKINVPFEVVIVDSGSTDRTLEIVQDYPVRLFQISPESFSFGYSLNYGIEQAKGSIIVNVSAHCIPVDGNWLHEIIDPIRRGDADAVYGRQAPIRGMNPYEEVSLRKHFPETDVKDWRVPFSNANCAFLKELWVNLKFDERIPSWEDYLWYFQLKDKARFYYSSNAAVFHSHPFSARAVSKRAYNDGVAFRILKERYAIDPVGDVCPTFSAKAKTAIRDILNHARIFIAQGHIKYLFSIPIVRALTYKAYWDGYNSDGFKDSAGKW